MSQDDNSKTDIESEEEIRKLRLQVLQLKNIIKKLTGQTDPDEQREEKKSKKGRPFDFNLFTKRHVLFRVAYFGWDLHGFAVQEITGKTVESELFRALKTTKLIEDREESNYHRCGRTDKGVSAFHQVISIDVRSNLLEGPGVFRYEGCRAAERLEKSIKNGEEIKEIDYCKILNSNLPDEIQVLAWAPCMSREFSARFDCVKRKYKYFFPQGDLSLDLMMEAGQQLIGGHDFRNFCKLDVNNGVVNYMRSIEKVTVEALEGSSDDDPYKMCVLSITGKAFLWHQIRCIVTLLFLIGQGKEKPNVITELLDIEKHPCRPQYGMASEIPLNLFYCEYGDDVQWIYDKEAHQVVMKQFQSIWTKHQVKATMVREALKEMEAKCDASVPTAQIDCLTPKNKAKNYIPLLDMMKCPSLEEKLSKNQSKKRKID